MDSPCADGIWRSAGCAGRVPPRESRGGGNPDPASVERDSANGTGEGTVALGGYASGGPDADRANRIRRIRAGGCIGESAGIRSGEAAEQRAAGSSGKSGDRGASNELVSPIGEATSGRPDFSRVVRRDETRAEKEGVHGGRDSHRRAGGYGVAWSKDRKS